jgi:O-antigen/teichoic acid export membrane protein
MPDDTNTTPSKDDESTSAIGLLLASSSVVFVGMILHMGLGFLSRWLIATQLGKVSYGAISLGYTVMLTTVVLVLLGINVGISRYLPRYDDPGEQRGVIVSAFELVVPLAVGAAIAMAILSGPIGRRVFNDPATVPIITIFALSVPLAVVVRLTVGTARGLKEALPRVLLQNVSLPVARFGLIAVAIFIGFEVVGVAWAYASSYALTAIFAVYYLFFHTPFLDDHTAERMHQTLLGFSAPLMVTATMNIAFSNLDTIMLGAFATTGDVGVYSTAYPLSNLLTVFLTAFAFIFMPSISELHANGKTDRMRRMYQLVTKWIALASLPVALTLIFFPSMIIRYTFGPEYLAGSLALSVLSLGFFVHVVAGPSGDTLTAMGKTRLVMYDNVFVVVVNAILNLILIPRYSYLGAAVASTVGFVLMNTLYIYQVRRDFGTHPFRRSLFRPALAATAIWLALYGTAVTVISVDRVIFLSVVAGFGLVYPVVILRFGGVEREEVEIIERVERDADVDLSWVKALARWLTR